PGLDAVGEHPHALGLGAERADDDAAVARMRAEHVVGVGVLAPDDEPELLGERYRRLLSRRHVSGGSRRTGPRWAPLIAAPPAGARCPPRARRPSRAGCSARSAARRP